MAAKLEKTKTPGVGVKPAPVGVEKVARGAPGRYARREQSLPSCRVGYTAPITTLVRRPGGVVGHLTRVSATHPTREVTVALSVGVGGARGRRRGDGGA